MTVMSVSIYALFLEKRVNGYMEMPGQAGHDDLDAGHDVLKPGIT